MIVPFPAFVLACITLAVSGIGYLIHMRQKYLYSLSLASYLLLGATVAYLVVETGVTSSPFIALWMLISVFAGLFGKTGILGAFLAVNGYIAAQYGLGNPLSKDELVVFVLAGELPILVSYVIWHSTNRHENEKDKAFNALAAELSEVSDKSQIVINAIADGVVAIDNKGIIQLFNPAAQSILGWSQEDAIGLNYPSVLKLANNKGDFLEDLMNPIQQVLTTNKTVTNNDLTLMTNTGKQLLVSLVVSPAGLHGSGAIIVFRDITQLKTEEREQTEFISTASHEMRTPVASIEGYLGLALNPATATIDDKARQYLTKAHESAQHLGRLFQDLLDVTKADDGRISHNMKIIDVVAFAGDITSLFETKAKGKNLMLLYKPGTGSDTGNDLNKKLSPVFYISADSDHLREVLSNLIDNAIKYTPQGSVVIDVDGDEETVTVSIHDSGIGIPPEDVGHLFQKFYRVDNSATREIGGTGLGLYLCRKLIESMNGKIWVESEFGKGSTFFVQFARISHEEAMAKLEQATEEAPETVVPMQGVPAPAAPVNPIAAAQTAPMPSASQQTVPIQAMPTQPLPQQTQAPAFVSPQPNPVQYPQQIQQQTAAPAANTTFAQPISTPPAPPIQQNQP